MSIPASNGKRSWNAGLLVSIVFHGALIVFLIQLVRPESHIAPPPKRQVIVELAPPPPPPPPPKVVPPPPKETPPPPPPKLTPPPPTPPPPVQAPVSTAPDAPVEPSVPPPAPPPPEPAPVAQPAARAVGTGVPTSYYNTLQSVIQKTVRYPSKSMRAGDEGVVKLRVRIDREGAILDVELLSKSGFIELDKEGRDVFRRIGRFPPVPASVGPEFTEFLVELPINFTLN